MVESRCLDGHNAPPARVLPVAGGGVPGPRAAIIANAMPHHPARGPRRVLRGGGAARPAGAARQAGDRRRQRSDPAGRGLGGQLRGARVRRALRDAAADGLPAVPPGRVPAGGRAQVPGGQPRGDGDPPPVHAPGAADLHRRGVPRRDGVAGAVRRRRDDRPDDQGAEPRRGGADGLGRAWRPPSSWRRSGPTCASRTGWWWCRRARRRRSSRRCRSRACGASARRPPRCCASSGSRRSATWPRCRRMPSSGGSGSTGPRSSGGRTGSTPTRWRPGSPRSRSGTSTRSGTTRVGPGGHRAHAPGHGRRSRVAAAGGGSQGGDDHLKLRDSRSPRSPAR